MLKAHWKISLIVGNDTHIVFGRLMFVEPVAEPDNFLYKIDIFLI